MAYSTLEDFFGDIVGKARRGQGIWVPQPDGRDDTLDPEMLDATADRLRAAGVPLL